MPFRSPGDVNGDGHPDIVVANSCDNGINCNNGTIGVLLGNGDGTFQPEIAYNSGGRSTSSVALADVNADGKLDVVVFNLLGNTVNNDSSIAVLLGNGDGTFHPAVTYDSGGAFQGGAFFFFPVIVQDVNRDGKPDIVVVNECASSSDCSTGGAGILLGNGDGTFQPAVAYNSGGGGADSIAVEDLNGDGKPDLVMAGACFDSKCSTSSVSVRLGNGDGTFQPAVIYSSAGYAAVSVVAGDVNGDGKPDIVVANLRASNISGQFLDGSIAVLLGNGDGTFQPPGQTYDSGGYDTQSISMRDMNGDGKPDLVVANQCATGPNCCNGTAAILLGNGDGTFGAAQSYGSGDLYPDSAMVADLRGDGKPDVIVAHQCADINCLNGTVGVLLGNGDGTFGAAVTYGSAGYDAVALAVGDVNNDGSLDVVVANACIDGGCATGTVAVLLGKGNGTFQPAVAYNSVGYDALSVAVIDVNGDGKSDLLVANSCLDSKCSTNTGGVSVLLGKGDGTFQPAVAYNSGGYTAQSVVAKDVNGDGKPDIIVANDCVSNNNCANGSVSVLRGNGDGTFQPAVAYSSGGYIAQSIVAADINGDGKPDLVVANQCVSSSNCADGAIGVLLGNGDGTFQTVVTYGSGGHADALAVGDLNNDGKLDLVLSSYCSSPCTNSTAVSVLLGNGNGTFQPAMLIQTPPTSFGGLVLADFNGDGKLDVASGSGNFLLLGNGDGTFQAPVPLGGGGPGIAVGDFNEDGTPDLAVGGVIILLNISARNTTTALSSSNNPSSFGQVITLTATVTPQGTGTPTGTVSFLDGTKNLGSVSLNGGVAILSIATLPVGTHSVTATYSGDTNFLSSTSPVLSQIVLGAIVAISPTSLNFGNQTVGVTSASESVTITNTGNATLNITSIAVSLSNGGFVQSNGCGSSLAAGASCVYALSWTPGTSGSMTGSITFTDSAANNPQTVSLAGVGVLPAVKFSPASLTFPTQVVFTTSRAETVTLTNTGSGILNIASIASTGPFAQTNTCGTIVSPGGSCSISVTFRPTTKGSLTGSISVTDNALGSPQKVTLKGTGTYIQMTPASLNFGNQPVGTKSLVKKITLTNKGNVSVNIGGVSITGVDFGDFSETNTCGATVKSGASCFISVTFTPTVRGQRTANVSVNDNGGGSPQKVILTGTGT